MRNTFINEELNYIKNFMEIMRKNRYRKGDTFVAQDLILNESYGVTESGGTCCAMVRRGILSIDGVIYFKMVDGNGSRKEITAHDILNGNVKGMFCAVNVYKVECDNMREYINEITNEFLD